VAYACLEVCLSLLDKTLASLLQWELTSLVEFDAWFDLPWFRGSMVFYIEKSCVLVTALLSWKLMFATHMAWFEGELVICCGFRGSWCFGVYIA
jgi:hypothetical protein